MTIYEVWDADTGNMLASTEDESEASATAERIRSVAPDPEDIVILTNPEVVW